MEQYNLQKYKFLPCKMKFEKYRFQRILKSSISLCQRNYGDPLLVGSLPQTHIRSLVGF